MKELDFYMYAFKSGSFAPYEQDLVSTLTFSDFP